MTNEQIAELKKFCIEQAKSYSPTFEELLKNAEKLMSFFRS